jgi:hypothetical protein
VLKPTVKKKGEAPHDEVPGGSDDGDEDR